MLTKVEIEAMSIKERATLAEMIWESIPVGDAIEAEIPDWHADILQKRLQEFLANPEDVIPWDEALAGLKSRDAHA
ncbi:MAG: addiction module protein [Ignavibacteriota bacterium]